MTKHLKQGLTKWTLTRKDRVKDRERESETEEKQLREKIQLR
jgi:hypothetical protein